MMNILSSKVQNTSGTILVNGVEERISKYKKLVGFVPQEDVMLRKLTVREVLDHSASLRLPSNWSRAQRKQFVDDVVSLLELGHIQNSVIGDEAERGISGGERKRVNIGIELVSDPYVLFLDEPTTGIHCTLARADALLARVGQQQLQECHALPQENCQQRHHRHLCHSPASLRDCRAE